MFEPGGAPKPELDANARSGKRENKSTKAKLKFETFHTRLEARIPPG